MREHDAREIEGGERSRTEITSWRRQSFLAPLQRLSSCMVSHLLLLASSALLVPMPRPRAPRISACAALPLEPVPELDVTGTINAICRGLQENDVGGIDTGVSRLYNFLTPMGRVARRLSSAHLWSRMRPP